MGMHPTESQDVTRKIIQHTILVVDDDPRLLEAHKRWLARCFPGSYVVARDTASSAIAVLACIKVDLVVSDFELADPSENGGNILLWIRRQQPALAARFVFLTGAEELAGAMHAQVLVKGAPTSESRAYLTSILHAPMV
jgi:ActR/RegA family two-component response regulator